MMKGRIASALLCGALLLLAACETRSISDSGYREDSRYGHSFGGNPFYRGELSELDVLGIERDRKITEDDIRKAFGDKQPLSVKKGSSILLVQSGALFPDTPMIKALEKYYTVAGFTGVPDRPDALGARGPGATAAGAPPVNSYAMTLRLAAAKGGYEKVVAYWGVLETARESMGTKVLSWVPFVGGSIPDEEQRMRIRLKLVVIDTRTGQWDSFTPDDHQDDAISASRSRASSDQAQVELLKNLAYASASEDFVKRYGR